VPRPTLEVFDCIRPPEGKAMATAGRFSLQLQVKYYWRQVGKRNRDKMDYAGTLPANQAEMKWGDAKGANEVVKWKHLQVRVFESNVSSPIQDSSFDIAIPIDDKVVVFRNQIIITANSAKNVEAEARQMLNDMGLTGVDLGKALNLLPPQEKEEGRTGHFHYSYLASYAMNNQPGRVEIEPAARFEKTRLADDKKLRIGD
jgi:hypothetical protein